MIRCFSRSVYCPVASVYVNISHSTILSSCRCLLILSQSYSSMLSRSVTVMALLSAECTAWYLVQVSLACINIFRIIHCCCITKTQWLVFTITIVTEKWKRYMERELGPWGNFVVNTDQFRPHKYPDTAVTWILLGSNSVAARYLDLVAGKIPYLSHL